MIDEKKITARINAMSREELIELVKKTLEESHIHYTIEEGGQIWSDIFTDENERSV